MTGGRTASVPCRHTTSRTFSRPRAQGCSETLPRGERAAWDRGRTGSLAQAHGQEIGSPPDRLLQPVLQGLPTSGWFPNEQGLREDLELLRSHPRSLQFPTTLSYLRVITGFLPCVAAGAQVVCPPAGERPASSKVEHPRMHE